MIYKMMTTQELACYLQKRFLPTTGRKRKWLCFHIYPSIPPILCNLYTKWWTITVERLRFNKNAKNV